MNFVQGFGFSLLQLLFGVMDLYTWILIIRALLSWVSPDPRNPLVQILVRLTEPVQRPLRKLAPPHKLGGLDLSPIVLLLACYFVQTVVIENLKKLFH